MTSGYAITTLVVFIASIFFVIRPVSIPTPRLLPRIPLNLTTAPILAIALLWAAQCIDPAVIRNGIVGTEGVKPYNILILFFSLAYMAITLDITGILQAAAYWVSNKGGHHGWKLYFYFYVMLTLISILLGNDPVILSGTAFLVYYTQVAELEPRAWIMAEFAAANTASMVLFVGNPTNVVICEGFNVNNAAFTAYTILPFLACNLFCFCALAFQFRKQVPRKLARVAKQNPRKALLDPIGALVGSFMLGATLIICLVVSFFGIDVWKITLPFAAAKFIFDLGWDHYRYSRGISMLGRGLKTAEVEIEDDSADGNPQPVEDIASRHPSPTVERSLPTPHDEETPVDPLPPASKLVSETERQLKLGTISQSHRASGGIKMRVLGRNKPYNLLCIPCIPNARKRTLTLTPMLGGGLPKAVEGRGGDGSVGEKPECMEGSTSDVERSLTGETLVDSHPQTPQIGLGTEPSMESEMELEREPQTTEAQLEPQTEVPLGSTEPQRESQTGSQADPETKTRKSLNPCRRYEAYMNDLHHRLDEHFPTFITALPRLPFALVPFAFSQFILIEALSHQGWVNVFARWLVRASHAAIHPTIWLIGVLGVILCNLSGTNIGATILLTKVVRTAALPYDVNRAAAIALAVSSNIGAVSFTFSASLAGLLWRTILGQKGVNVKQREFAFWNLLPLSVMTAVGLGVVSAEMAILFQS